MKERLFVEDSKKEIRIEEMLMKEFSTALCGGFDIQETPLGTRITIYTMIPGLVIGSGGEKIKYITEKLRADFGLKNVQIDVQKIRKPELNPSVVAQSIAAALEKGMNYKKLGNFYLSKVMRAGARGCEIVIAGKLGGEKSRKERFYAGFVEKSGTREFVLKGTAVANPKLGNIGIKVFIMMEKEPAAEHHDIEKEAEKVVEEVIKEEQPAEQKSEEAGEQNIEEAAAEVAEPAAEKAESEEEEKAD